jgi:hypothetical protein
LALFKFPGIVAPIFYRQWMAVMMLEPSLVTKRETHLGYEIRVATVGPIQTEQNEPANLRTHHQTRISIWLNGNEVRGAGEAPFMRFLSREDADEFGFEIGRMIVAQRRQSTSNLIARTRERIKLPRLFFRNLAFRL